MNYELIAYYHNLFGACVDTQYRSTSSYNIRFPIGHATIHCLVKALNLPVNHKFPIDDIVKATVGTKNKLPSLFEFYCGDPKLSDKATLNLSFTEGSGSGDVFLVHGILGKVSGIDFGKLPSDRILRESVQYLDRNTNSRSGQGYVRDMKDAYLDMRRGSSIINLMAPASPGSLNGELRPALDQILAGSYYSSTKSTFRTGGINQAVFLFDTLRNIMGDTDNARLLAMFKGIPATELLKPDGLAAMASREWHTYMAMVCYYRLINPEAKFLLKKSSCWKSSHPSLHLAVKILAGQIPVDQNFHTFFKYCVAVSIGGSCLSGTGTASNLRVESIPVVVRDAINLMNLNEGTMNRATCADIYTAAFGQDIAKYYFGIGAVYRHTDGPTSLLQAHSNHHSLHVVRGLNPLDASSPASLDSWLANNSRAFVSRVYEYRANSRQYSGNPYAIMYCGKHFNGTDVDGESHHICSAINHIVNWSPIIEGRSNQMRLNNYYKSMWDQQITSIRSVLGKANLPNTVGEVPEGSISYLAYLIGVHNADTSWDVQNFIPYGGTSDISRIINADIFENGLLDQPVFNLIFNKIGFSASITDITGKVAAMGRVQDLSAVLGNVVRHIAAVSEMQQFIFGRTTLDVSSIIQNSYLTEDQVKKISRPSTTRGFGGTLLSYALRRATVNS